MPLRIESDLVRLVPRLTDDPARLRFGLLLKIADFSVERLHEIRDPSSRDLEGIDALRGLVLVSPVRLLVSNLKLRLELPHTTLQSLDAVGHTGQILENLAGVVPSFHRAEPGLADAIGHRRWRQIEFFDVHRWPLSSAGREEPYFD